MCHHVLNQNIIFRLFCFYPFVSHFNIIKLSLPPVLLFCLPGTEDIGKGDGLAKGEKAALCQQPQEVPWEVLWKLRNIFCQAAEGQQGIFCCQTALSRSYKSEPFLGVINSTQHSSPLTQKCKLTPWFLHVKVLMKVKAWPLWAGNSAVWTTHKLQLSLQNTGKHSEHLQNDKPAFGWTLLYLQGEQWSAWIKPSEAQLAVWFIILTLSLQRSFSA